MLKRIISCLAIILAVVSCSNQNEEEKLISEIKTSLQTKVLNAWYPRALDEQDGGYLSTFTYDWKPVGPQEKVLVPQSRHIYTTSSAAIFLEEEKYLKYASHGVAFLKDKMWDQKYGGFFAKVTKTGRPIIPSKGAVKTTYGNAFAIYALARYYAASGDTAALDLAKSTFRWIDTHSRDSIHNGYFDLLKQNGSWCTERYTDETHQFLSGAQFKDQNSTIHLLEAYTELYKVWQDSLLRERLFELLVLVRDTFTNEKGFLILNFERDWTPFSLRDSTESFRRANQFFDLVSFGHDVETAYLMLEASHALGLTSDQKTLQVAQKMVDHSLATGWDSKHGGFYYEGWYEDDMKTVTIINDSKAWWVQAEALNSYLLMSGLFPEEKQYYATFLKLWDYVNTYQIDHEHGGWREHGIDTRPGNRHGLKAHAWKANYHVARALINCIELLRGEHELLKFNFH